MRRKPLPEDALDKTDRAIINTLQEGFPLSPRPFAEMAARFDIDETELIDRIAHMRNIGAITRFGPFIDAAAMGGAFCLCAMKVPEDRFEEVMTLVNAFPEVAHNYERVHALNMWFVLACDRTEDIGKTADRIEAQTGLTVQRFPKLREFYIGFKVTA
ncbi:MAG: Lrp/AsnC family transcriptional regulator [Rhodobacteraceae bacterium]|nr:Lrp/AsnC family transcriptional regulator [Paracoccaceae bacterium]